MPSFNVVTKVTWHMSVHAASEDVLDAAVRRALRRYLEEEDSETLVHCGLDDFTVLGVDGDPEPHTRIATAVAARKKTCK